MDPFGHIDPPQGVSDYVARGGADGGALFLFITNIFKLLGAIAGIYLVVQLILAGYNYLSANGDSKKTEAAWAQIWQSLLGIVIVASAFVIAGVVGRLVGIDILNPQFYGP